GGSSGRGGSRSWGAYRTPDRCKPGRCTTGKADAVVAFLQSALALNGCDRDEVDRSCPPHFCRVPAAQLSAPKSLVNSGNARHSGAAPTVRAATVISRITARDRVARATLPSDGFRLCGVEVRKPNAACAISLAYVCASQA